MRPTVPATSTSWVGRVQILTEIGFTGNMRIVPGRHISQILEALGTMGEFASPIQQIPNKLTDRALRDVSARLTSYCLSY